MGNRFVECTAQEHSKPKTLSDIGISRKELLLKQGRENMSDGKKYGLSTIDKPLHNTQKEIAEELEEITGLEWQTIQQYKSISDKLDTNLRRDDLSFNHHREVAKLPPENKKPRCRGLFLV